MCQQPCEQHFDRVLAIVDAGANALTVLEQRGRRWPVLGCAHVGSSSRCCCSSTKATATESWPEEITVRRWLYQHRPAVNKQQISARSERRQPSSNGLRVRAPPTRD